MSLRRAKSRKRASITSLIDVIFLLLLFFMLASTFSRHAEFEISTSADGAGSAASPIVARLIIEPARLLLDGQPLRDDELSAQLTKRIADDPSTLLVSASPTATTQRFVDILIQLGAFTGLEFQIEAPA